MAKSYYKIVKGVRYDRALLEAAENRIKGQGDGRISEQDLKELVDLSEDGKGITVTELRTLRYIQDEFNLTEKAQRWLTDNISRLERGKISSESEEGASQEKSTHAEVETEDQIDKANEPYGDEKDGPNQINNSGAELNTSEDAEETSEKETKLRGEVFAVERLGGETYLYVNTESNKELTVHAAGDKVVSVGDSVSIGFSPNTCHVFDLSLIHI